jgi:negative regulator of flagellin synthesis FlgM
MVNNINNPNIPGGSLPSGSGNRANGAAGGASPPAGGTGQPSQSPPSHEQVELSHHAQTLKTLESKLGKQPGLQESGVDQQKVERLKKALQEGSFTVNPERLADSIMEFEFSLPG